ncbi:3-deoxy-D-manno-octulosonic acid transferase [Roseibaca ekhonensis]|uniref:3-deoxy-D-manno-octulosonic acid transferase n=1 Tax=Roseinatronobacter ekhonensis TaxID=254356 RepID=A0A3B0M6B9_9RHOB|nr:3-deoxy-D-manno-octulosonic acid transferase [Roseibaca ekhonensis]
MTGRLDHRVSEDGMSLVAGLGSPLVWLHCDSPSRLEKLTALSEAVLQADEEVGVLLIYPQACPPPAEIPRRLCLPCADDGAALGRKLAAKTRIGAALIAARSLPAGVVAPLAKQGTRVLLAEMAVPRAEGFWSMTPGYKRRAFSRVSHVFLATERARALWREAGFADERLSVIGTLSQVPLALKCNETERETLAESLRHRTVWLAAGVPPEEEERVIAVQQEALRESHRLALILHPADPMRGPELYARFAHQFTMALRSRDDPITPETQVYIADTEGERGLWYRLAVACYMGGSFSKGSSFSPMEAAGLGCAIVHGPEKGQFAAAFDLLAERRATRRLTRPPALGAMMRAVLRPEQAAEMAHRGWQIVSEGSEATETLVTALLAACRE